jgi:hypothetical protein
MKSIHIFYLCLTLRLTNEVAGYCGGHGSLTRNDIVPKGLKAEQQCELNIKVIILRTVTVLGGF